MKFLKKHKLLSFAVISFVLLAGVDLYMIIELIQLLQFGNVQLGTVLF